MVINLDAGMIIGLVIISFVAIIMVTIGMRQVFQKDTPVGFYNLIDPPKKEEITNVILWNKKHGMMWIIYGICIEAGFWLGYILTGEVLEMIFMTGGVVIPLPFMIARHHKLEKMFKVK